MAVPKLAQADRVHDALMKLAEKVDSLPTKEDLRSAIEHALEPYVTKDDLRTALEPYVTKDEFHASQAAMMAQIGQYFQRMETRFDQMQQQLDTIKRGPG